MPYSDLEVEKVWLETKRVVNAGTIVRKVDAKRRYTNFPNKKFNHASHVRPHAQNADSTHPLPVRDSFTGKLVYTKHCFWLNNRFSRDEIYLKNT